MKTPLPLLPFALLLAMPGTAAADTLLEVYRKAVVADPAVREAEASRLATQESRPQALAALLPQLTGSAGTAWNNSNGDNSRVFGNQPATFIIDTRDQTDTWGIDLRQTVFRWDQWVRLDQSGKEATQAEFDYTFARQDLIIRVADAYFNVLAAEDTLNAERAAKEAIGQQLEQAQKRFEVGLIAITDVQEAQAAFDNAVALEIAAKRNLANQREVLRAIIDDYPEVLAKPTSEIPLVPPEPSDVNRWVDLAMQQNASLLSSQVGAEIAKDNIRIAQSAFAPTVDLVASRGKTDSAGFARNLRGNPPVRFRDETAFTNYQDQVGIQVSMPFFTGGANTSRVRQAVYQHRAARERLERASRETERSTRDAYLGVITDVSRVQSLRQALESARTALKASEAGFEVGTRTTVDVLIARRNLLSAEVNYLRSRYDYLLDGLRLKQAAGSLTDTDLERIDTLLKDTSTLTKPDLSAPPPLPAPRPSPMPPAG
ncbi:MAG: TolC family outer membrane protein [Chromatiales bacterium]|jgi:outer membrane protein|nr:TolC family outer membrane protein [Chromatiales bacterium]